MAVLGAVRATAVRKRCPPNTEKFLYLRLVISGKAAAAITGIQVTGANDTTVLELTKERFGRRDVLIQGHLAQLLDFPPIDNEKEPFGLRRHYETTKAEGRKPATQCRWSHGARAEN